MNDINFYFKSISGFMALYTCGSFDSSFFVVFLFVCLLLFFLSRYVWYSSIELSEIEKFGK